MISDQNSGRVHDKRNTNQKNQTPTNNRRKIKDRKGENVDFEIKPRENEPVETIVTFMSLMTMKQL